MKRSRGRSTSPNTRKNGVIDAVHGGRSNIYTVLGHGDGSFKMAAEGAAHAGIANQLLSAKQR